MPATAIADEPLVSQPERSLLFMARRSELRLVMVPRYPQVVASTGQRLGETRGITVAFLDGQFRVQRPESEGGEPVVQRIMDPGGAGQADVPAKDLLAFLENHPLKDSRTDGFWRVDATAPPVSREEMDRIAEAAVDMDVPKLEAIISQETGGWGREDILKVAQGSIDRIRALEEATNVRIAEAEAEAAEQARAAEAETQELRRQLAEAKKAAKKAAE